MSIESRISQTIERAVHDHLMILSIEGIKDDGDSVNQGGNGEAQYSRQSRRR